MKAIGTTKVLEKDAKYCSQGDISARRKPKKMFAQAQGEWLIDSDGCRYLDLQMCNSAANFGYRSAEHLRAIQQQAEALPSLASEFLHEERVLLAERICKLMEERFGVKGRVHFSVGGAQAIDDALKLIGRLTKTTRVFGFQGSYHGRTLAASSISGAYRYRSGFGGTALADFVPFPYCNRCPYDQKPSSCHYECVSHFDRLFDGEAAGQNDGHGRPECRSFIVEPVLGRGGYIAAPPEYFSRLKAILDKHGILFVVDEIQMGFFRAGKLWSIENYGVVPDIVTFGKAITNGMYPLSGIWAREPLMSPENWPTGSSHATFAGAPLGTALGLATLDLCAAQDWESRAEKIGAAFESICKRLSSKFPHIRYVNRIGAAISLDIAKLDGKPDSAMARAIVETALGGEIQVAGGTVGLILTVGGGNDNMIMIAPSLSIEDSSIEVAEQILGAVLKTVVREHAS